MQNFDYRTPTRLIFGKGSISELPDALRPLGKTILLTYGGGSIKKTGLYDKVKSLLADFNIIELSGIQPNPKYNPSVLDGIRLCKENKVDAILAVGGGSVLDCSKAIAAGAKYDGEAWDLIIGKVPTTREFPQLSEFFSPLKHMQKPISRGLRAIAENNLMPEWLALVIPQS